MVSGITEPGRAEGGEDATLQDEMRFPIVFHLEPRDLSHARRLHLRRHMSSGGGLVRLAIVWAVYIAVFAVLLMALDTQGNLLVKTIVFALLAPLVLTGASFLANILTSGRQAKKIFMQHKALQMPISLSWTGDGFLMESEGGSARIAWADLAKAHQDRHSILMYESDALYRLVPKRVLTDAQIRDLTARLCLARQVCREQAVRSRFRSFRFTASPAPGRCGSGWPR